MICRMTPRIFGRVVSRDESAINFIQRLSAVLKRLRHVVHSPERRLSVHNEVEFNQDPITSIIGRDGLEAQH